MYSGLSGSDMLYIVLRTIPIGIQNLDPVFHRRPESRLFSRLCSYQIGNRFDIARNCHPLTVFHGLKQLSKFVSCFTHTDNPFAFLLIIARDLVIYIGPIPICIVIRYKC